MYSLKINTALHIARCMNSRHSSQMRHEGLQVRGRLAFQMEYTLIQGP